MKKTLHFRMLLLAAVFAWGMSPSPGASCPVPCDPVPVVSDVILIYAMPPDLDSWYDVTGDLENGYSMCLNPWQVFYNINVDDLNSTVPLMQEHMNPFYLTGTYPQSFYDYWSAKGVNALATDPATWQYWMYRIIQGTEPMFYVTQHAGMHKTVDGLQYLASGGLLQDYLRISGDYPSDTYTYKGQIMDETGCMTDDIIVTMTTTHMVLESVSMKSATDPDGPWTPVQGDLDAGYSMVLDHANTFYYLDIDELNVSPGAAVDNLNAFFLTGTYPQSFFDYWNLKGVNAGATEPQWQYYMWRIINGWDPMFYILNTGSGYTLIDGLQYVASGTVLDHLRVSGDYPEDTYTFSGQLTNDAGCWTPVQDVAITFLSSPECLITGEEEACATSTVAFTAPAGMQEYAWTITGNGVITTGDRMQVVHVTAGPSGSFTLSLVVTGENGCSSSCQQVVRILSRPTVVSCISGPSWVCGNETGVSYTVSMQNANEFNWDITPGGTIVNQVDDILADPAVSTVTVDFQNTNANVTVSVTGINHQGVLCEGKKQSQHVKVNPIPGTPVIAVSGKNLTSSSANGNQWYFNASSPTGPWTLIPGANKKKYTAQATGWHTVDVTSNFDCTSEKALAVFVSVTKEALAGEEDGDATPVSVYPNPGDGHFTLTLNSSSGLSFKVQVYTSMGIRVMETKTPATSGLQRLTLDLSARPDGVYSIVLMNDEEQIVKRVIVRK